jgi:hypothetical protein
VNNLALLRSSDLSFGRQLEMVEVVDHLFDDFGVISIAKAVEIAFVGMRFEAGNASDRFLSMC